ncbi:MAG: ABC transporter permease, partial [Bacteroidales bacterium]
MNPFHLFYRTLIRNKQLYLLNMLGLIPGLACCLLILLWIRYEYRIDRHYPEAENIITVSGYHEGRSPFGGAPPAIAPRLAEEHPEVKKFSRVAWAGRSVNYQNESYGIVSFDVDPGYFSIFGVEFINGSAFNEGEVTKCVVSESAAIEIFGDKNAVGESLKFDFGEFEVSGVMKDPGKNSTALAPAAELSRPGVCIVVPV